MSGVIPVVIVDDDARFRAVVAAWLAASGFEMRGEASSGEVAIEMLGDEPVLMLMDVNMPGLGGVRAAEVVRRRCPDAVVVLISTCDPSDLPADVATCGAAGFIRKDELTPHAARRMWQERG